MTAPDRVELHASVGQRTRSHIRARSIVGSKLLPGLGRNVGMCTRTDEPLCAVRARTCKHSGDHADGAVVKEGLLAVDVDGAVAKEGLRGVGQPGRSHRHRCSIPRDGRRHSSSKRGADGK